MKLAQDLQSWDRVGAKQLSAGGTTEPTLYISIGLSLNLVFAQSRESGDCSGPAYIRPSPLFSRIPPRGVGGLFKSSLQPTELKTIESRPFRC